MTSVFGYIRTSRRLQEGVPGMALPPRSCSSGEPVCPWPNVHRDVGEASWPVEIRAGASDAQPQTANSPAIGEPAISGTAQVDGTLSTDTSSIADADGLANASFAYQWLADDADISGATGSTYTLAESDEGKAITVTVSFTDDRGNEEELTSAATAAVAAPAADGRHRERRYVP